MCVCYSILTNVLRLDPSNEKSGNSTALIRAGS